MSDNYVELYGVHGTCKDRAEDIKTGGFDLPKGDKGYYGKGVYFYEDSEKGRRYAFNWAKYHKKCDSPCVIRAEICCSLTNYLDLTSNEIKIKQLIEKCSKLCSTNKLNFNEEIRKWFISIINANIRNNGADFHVLKVFVPENCGHGWDVGLVVRRPRCIKNQNIIDFKE